MWKCARGHRVNKYNPPPTPLQSKCLYSILPATPVFGGTLVWSVWNASWIHSGYEKAGTLKKRDPNKESSNESLKSMFENSKVQKAFESSNKCLKIQKKLLKVWTLKRQFENSKDSLKILKTVWKFKNLKERKWPGTFSQFTYSNCLNNKMTLITTVSMAKYLSNRMYMPLTLNIYFIKTYPNRIAF